MELKNKPVKMKDLIKPLLEEDEDAVVASLVATIEYHNETKKDVHVVSIKEI